MLDCSVSCLGSRQMGMLPTLRICVVYDHEDGEAAPCFHRWIEELLHDAADEASSRRDCQAVSRALQNACAEKLCSKRAQGRE